LEDETAEIVKYTGEERDLIVPAALDTVRVSRIGKSAFSYNQSIRNVTLPDGLQEIGESAFSGIPGSKLFHCRTV
jgi:hypothetical protein